ncbi:MAG: sugar transferase [Candidatus Krumholzibacteriaceae bacterium]|jgi:lipopolysaccharide/colanic/teichoic acid biosynthesis glycosyltransferase
MRKQSMALDSTQKFQQLTESLASPAGTKFRERMWAERFVKRSIDVVSASLVTVLGFPFFLAVALLIKLTSRGPVFYSQLRIGEQGEVFTLYKFRTMRQGVDDAIHREFTRTFIEGRMSNSSLDEKAPSVYKLTNDPRVTSIGNFLRKTSLDELPQFINILKGEMTIVGPRPPLQYELEYYEEWHKLRLEVKPGLTGLWQVSGRSSVPFNEMVKLDLYYIEHWTLLLDFKIMMRTIPVMLFGSGGY